MSLRQDGRVGLVIPTTNFLKKLPKEKGLEDDLGIGIGIRIGIGICLNDHKTITIPVNRDHMFIAIAAQMPHTRTANWFFNFEIKFHNCSSTVFHEI